MANQRDGVVGGVDAHADEHHVAVVDLQGRLLNATAFPTTAAGYAQLISWLQSHGEVERVGVESTGAYAAGLVRALRARTGERGVDVVYDGTGATLDGTNVPVNITVNASYVIVRGFTLKNAQQHGILIDKNQHDVIIEDNDISNWGRTRDGT